MNDFLVAFRWLLLAAAILAWALFVWMLLRQGQGGKLATASTGSVRSGRQAGGRQPPRKPADVVPLNRTSTGSGLAPSIEAGLVEHHIRSAAATAKLSPPGVGDKHRPTEAMLKAQRASGSDEVVGGTTENLDATPKASGIQAAKDAMIASLTVDPGATAEASEARALKNAETQEKKGFHHQIESEKVPVIADPDRPAAPPAPPIARTASSAPPVAAPAAPSTASLAKPRTQTAELDDILKRIDQVLADNPAPAAAAPPSARPVTEAIKPAERLDPSEVLKRIDEALAESQVDRAGEATMLRPDWERDAKRSLEQTMPRPDWVDEAKKDAPIQRTVEPPRQPTAPTKPSEITHPKPGWVDEAQQIQPQPPVANPAKLPAAQPKPAAAKDERSIKTETPDKADKPATGGKAAMPDWARGDIQDEDLQAKPETEAKKDAPATEPPSAKGDGPAPGQQKLF